MGEFRIEPFDKSKHERSGFRCGHPVLDEFICKLATQYDKRKLGKTFVALPTDKSNVIGFYTLAASAIAFARMPIEAARKLPKHPIPVILLARLAVDQPWQGRGLGEMLLVDALTRSLELSKSLGVFGVEVRAIDERAMAFYGKFGFDSLPDDAHSMFLSISTIEEAVKSKKG